MKVYGTARLSGEPELKYTGDGKAYCFLRLRSTRHYAGKTYTDNIDAKAFGKVAEGMTEFAKGEIVEVEGTIRPNKREIGGKDVWVMDVIVERISKVSFDEADG